MMYKVQVRFLFHSDIKIKIPEIYDDSVFDDLFGILEEVNKRYNSYSENSYIDKINKNSGHFVKVDIETVEILRKINPVAFDYIKDNRHVNLGFIAQNVQEFMPEAVFHQSQDKDKMLYLVYQNFVPYLVKAIQQLSNKVEDLERKLQHE